MTLEDIAKEILSGEFAFYGEYGELDRNLIQLKFKLDNQKFNQLMKLPLMTNAHDFKYLASGRLPNLEQSQPNKGK